MHAPSASTPQLRAAHARGRRSSALLRSGVTDGVTRVWVTMLRSVFTTLVDGYYVTAGQRPNGATANGNAAPRRRGAPPSTSPRKEILSYTMQSNHSTRRALGSAEHRALGLSILASHRHLGFSFAQPFWRNLNSNCVDLRRQDQIWHRQPADSMRRQSDAYISPVCQMQIRMMPFCLCNLADSVEESHRSTPVLGHKFFGDDFLIGGERPVVDASPATSAMPYLLPAADMAGVCAAAKLSRRVARRIRMAGEGACRTESAETPEPSNVV